jgi:Zn-dependent protease
MDMNQIADGLIQYLMLVGLLTFHEYGHAWTAMKCGDDTAKVMGRVSLNPIVHIDPIGTVLLPLVMIFVPGAGKFLIGWAKPVPVNVHNLRHKNRDDILVTMAGPAVNLILAFGLVGLAKAGVLFHSEAMMEICIRAAALSLILCFFNLIPIPPLDGSHVLRVLTGMTWETYLRFSQFGFIAVILVLQIPAVSQTLSLVTMGTLRLMIKIFGL